MTSTRRGFLAGSALFVAAAAADVVALEDAQAGVTVETAAGKVRGTMTR